MKLVYGGADFSNQRISVVMGKPLPEIDENTEVSEAYRILLSGSSAVMVLENSVPKAVLTRIDLIDFYARKRRK